MAPRNPWDVRTTLRPMPEWPHQVTQRREDAKFYSNQRRSRIPYNETLEELKYEVWRLDGDNIVLGVGLAEHEVRLDGAPRSNAREPRHPGVEISFDSRHGHLTYATDQYTRWQDNVRAIAKALEALRAIDRWGVSKRGQQYAGFAQLTAGPDLEDLGRQLVRQFGSIPAALRATHPDTGGPTASNRDFSAVIAFRDSQRVTA